MSLAFFFNNFVRYPFFGGIIITYHNNNDDNDTKDNNVIITSVALKTSLNEDSAHWLRQMELWTF